MLLDIQKLKEYENKLNQEECSCEEEFHYNKLLYINSDLIKKLECVALMCCETPVEEIGTEKKKQKRFQVNIEYEYEKEDMRIITFAFYETPNQRSMAHTIRCMINNNQK